MKVYALTFVLLFSICGCGVQEPTLITFTEDGGWCWFQDERTIIHDGHLIIGSVPSGHVDILRRGDVELVIYRLADGLTQTVELHDQLRLDDHNAPALLSLPNEQVVAVYSGHGMDENIRVRRTESPNDLLRWSPEEVLPMDLIEGRGVTYSNLYRLSQENQGDGRLYNFFRGSGWDPNFIISDSNGDTWTYGGRLLDGPGRPYVRYASNNIDTIHFVCTDQHPRDFDNSVYHGYLKQGNVYSSDGVSLGAPGKNPLTHEQLTKIYEGSADRVAWVADLDLDSNDQPVMVFSVQRDGAGKPREEGGSDHRYHYARWDGKNWNEYEIAYGGTRLYPGEDDYTGLISLDPQSLNTVYISTNAEPVTGEPLISRTDGLRHYEIYRGMTPDGGRTWIWTALTQNSTVDNLRPLVPIWESDQVAVLWLQGEYRTFKDYTQRIVGVIMRRPQL